MTKWEYRIVEAGIATIATNKAADLLNELGADGWELVAVATTHGIVAVFKRPMGNEPIRDEGRGGADPQPAKPGEE